MISSYRTSKLLLIFAAVVLSVPPGGSQQQQFFGCDGYHFSTFKATWETARQTCRDRQYGDLAAFDTDGEYEHLRYIYKTSGGSAGTSQQYWTSGSTNNSYGIFVWHSSGVPVKESPAIVAHIANVQTFALMSTPLQSSPGFLLGDMSSAVPSITQASGNAEHFFVCELQTHECRINKTLSVGTELDAVGMGARSDGTALMASAEPTQQRAGPYCYVVSRCKASQHFARLACQRRHYGDLLAVESEAELQLVLQVLKKARSGEQYWTSGARITQIEWDSTNTTLPPEDTPDSFDWYLKSKYRTLGLAMSVGSKGGRGTDWTFLEPAADLKFICELKIPQCNNFRGGGTGNTESLQANTQKPDVADSVTEGGSEGHHVNKRAPANSKQTTQTGPFYVFKSEDKCYILYNGTIHPDEYAEYCRSYNWQGFDMDKPSERVSVYKELLSKATLIQTSTTTYESVPVCTSGITKTEYKWLAVNENIQKYKPVPLQELPQRRIYLYQRYTQVGNTKTYSHYGWKVDSAEQLTLQRCHPACETKC